MVPQASSSPDARAQRIRQRRQTRGRRQLRQSASDALEAAPRGSAAQRLRAGTTRGWPSSAPAAGRRDSDVPGVGRQPPTGYLAEAAALSEAEADEALGDYTAAVAVYERLGTTRSTAPDDVLLRLGRAARAGHDDVKAFSAYSRLYFEFPFSDLAAAARVELDQWVGREPISDRRPALQARARARRAAVRRQALHPGARRRSRPCAIRPGR